MSVIDDVVNENGTFLDYREICNKFGKILTHFQYMSLIDAIPKEWRKMLKNHTLSHEVCNKDEPPYYCNGKCEIPLLKLTSNRIYWDKIDSNLQNPTCITSWSKRINVATDKQFWKHAFTLPPQNGIKTLQGYVNYVKKMKVILFTLFMGVNTA